MVVVAGDEGNRNAGDQAMFLGLVSRLRTRVPNCRITSLSRHPSGVLDIEGVERYYGAYDYLLAERGPLTRRFEGLVPRFRKPILLWRGLLLVLAARLMRIGVSPFFVSKSAKSLLRLLRDSSLLISCGGGYLNTIWTFDSLCPFSIVYRAAACLGRPVVLSGQGIGPITARMDRRVLRWGLGCANKIGLREAGEGFAYLKSLGLPEDRLAETGDDAAGLEACGAADVARILAKEMAPSDKPIITAQFRLTSHTKSYANEYQQFADLLDQIIERMGCHVLFVPIGYSPDADDRLAAYAVTMRMRSRTSTSVVTGEYRPEVIKALVGLGKVAVGVSYHFGVFALTQGVPFFALYENEYYRLKFTGLYGHFGRPDWYVPFTSLDVDAEADRICSVARDREALSRDLLSRSREMENRVDAHYDYIAGLIR